MVAMADHDADTVEYFALIAKCADATMKNKPDHLSPRAYWRKLIQDRWHDVNSHLTTPFAEMAIDNYPGCRAGTFAKLAQLSQVVEMAAWWITMRDEPGSMDGDIVATVFADEVKPFGKKTR